MEELFTAALQVANEVGQQMALYPPTLASLRRLAELTNRFCAHNQSLSNKMAQRS